MTWQYNPERGDIPVHFLDLLEMAERAQARCAAIKQVLTIREATEAEVQSYNDALTLVRLSHAVNREARRQEDATRPAGGIINGLMLAAIIDMLIMLAVYGHRVALWIDGWRLP